MDEVYPIEVLHVVNPHVIFVETKNPGKSLVIEQVGIYGIIPVNQTIDIDGNVVAERCENWPAVATTIIIKFLADHAQAYFKPIQDECRSTIFNNNSIKFGYIFIQGGKKIASLHEHLIKHSVAEQNEAIFHQKLSSGSLKLKLNYVRSEEVLKEIKKYYIKQKRDKKDWQDAIHKQTTLYQESKNIANKLTAKNLELLQRNEEQPCNLMALIDRKTKDLDLCKNADEISIGCGSRRNKVGDSNQTDQSQLHDNNENSPSRMLYHIRKFLAANAKTNGKPPVEDDIKLDFNDNHSQQSTVALNNESEESLKDIQNSDQVDSKRSHQTPDSRSSRSEGNNANSHRNFKTDKTHDRYRHSKNNFGRKKYDFDSPDGMKSSPDINRREKAKPQASTKVLKRTPGKYLVAFGPPNVDPSSLKIQQMANEVLPTINKKIEVKDKDEKIEDNHENIATEDSNIDFKVNVEKIINIDRRPSQSKLNCPSNEHKNNINSAPDKTFDNNSNTLDVAENCTTPLPTDKRLRILLRKARVQKINLDNSISSNSDTSVKDTSSSGIEMLNDDENIDVIKDKLNAEYKPIIVETKEKIVSVQNITKVERNVNPFKNLDGSKSIFVEKVVGPVLMVHSKNDNLILPQCNLRDVPFKTDIQIALKNMNIKEPFRLQTVSWSYILRGHSLFMIGPPRGGKTIGYVPAVCNLVMDSINTTSSSGPICIIVCATAASVTAVEDHCKRFLGLDEVVLPCFAGMDMSKFVLSLLNGCHILVCTAAMLYRLLGTDISVDLRRLSTLVFEDCERLSQVYASEIKIILHHVKDMLKNRADTSMKVQYLVASEQWCDFMTPLAKNAPDTIIAISAFQECVPYSKTNTSVQFVLKDNKVHAVVEFMKEIDGSKRTVIVCRSDDEVQDLETVLKRAKHAVFACDNKMTVHDLYNLNVAWDNYEEPVLGPILICCDGNLTHLNVTNANYLVHFSMPELFSMFCKRFAVINDNYPSIFETVKKNVKVKILLEESNAEQLPKILNFVKRCTNQVFPMLSEITRQVLEKKDVAKAKNLVPICNSLMTLGECADVWSCRERHAVLKEFDEPKPWMPKEGIINFKIMFYSSAVSYSARILSNMTKSGVTKYPNNFSTLSLKMGMYYSKEINRKPQGIIKLGDICAVAVKPNFFERCQVIKILSYSKGNPHFVRINLIDEERLEDSKDVHLYHLPDEFKVIETHVVKVRLANVQPQDKDVTFSALARNELKKLTDNDENLYLRGDVIMTVGNCVFVDSLEACQDLSSLGETVVKYDIKKELLSRHAEPNPQHIPKLEMLGGVVAETDNKVEVTVPTKIVRRPKWAHLDKDDISTVIFAAALNASCFFVRLEKFQKVIDSLIKDIEKIVESSEELPQEEIYVGNIILAQFPDDNTYERARIDVVINEKKVKCFFVDNGDWRDVPVKCLRPITDNVLHRVPFQAIECRLVGVRPPFDEWTEFGTNWLCNNCFEDDDGKTKYLFAKYCTKEAATITGGHKYAIVLVDTSSDSDVVVNKQMIELNLARENDSESELLNQPLNMKSLKITDSSSDQDDFLENNHTTANGTVTDFIPHSSMQDSAVEEETNDISRQILFGKPIRSVPLINDSDCSDSDISINFDQEMVKMLNIGSVPANPSVASEPNNIIVNSKLKLEKEPTIKKKSDSARVLELQSDSDDIEPDRFEALTTFKDQLQSRDDSEIHTITDHDKHILQNISKNDKPNKNDLDSDDLSSVTSSLQNSDTIQITKGHSPKIVDITDPSRKPKLIWRQNKSSVTVKIQLIGVENYTLDIKEKFIKFNAFHNDTNYEFDFELYGVVNLQKCRHSSKGQYILVVLPKIIKSNWMNLSRDYTIKNWISYDVDAIGSSSDEETSAHEEVLNVLRRSYEKEETESEDDEFADDANFSYKKHLDD